jgi:hypothetical protein
MFADRKRCSMPILTGQANFVRLHLLQTIFGAIDFLKSQNCTNIGLSLGGETIPSHLDWEYPFWALLQGDKGRKIRFQHILHPGNTSSRFLQEAPYKDFDACAIIATRSKDKPLAEKMIVNGATYISKWSSKPVSVLMKQ